MYVDDFVFFSPDDAVEQKFQRILSNLIKVDFMGVVEWFLGIHFSWQVTGGEVDVHLNQAGFAAYLVERFNLHHKSPTPTATPYRSGIPIDSIAAAESTDNSPAQARRKEAYQSLVGSIGWLANNTRPDVAPVHSFLSSYSASPAPGHMKAALYALHYIHSTHDYGIQFTSRDTKPIHTYLHFPDSSDSEVYEDAMPPKQNRLHHLTTYSDANWGSQIGNAVRDGTMLPLFKFRSMSGAIVFRAGGPIAWKSVRQERTSLSSCEAEIRATNEGAKLTIALRNLADGFADCGVTLPDAKVPTVVYNDNQSCVSWSHNQTMKQTRHMELRDNSVREWVQDNIITVKHVAGKCNPSDIFTKEMKDGAHFRRLRDSFMCRHSDFLRTSMTAIFRSQRETLAAQHASSDILSPVTNVTHSTGFPASYLDCLLSSALLRTKVNISHLSSAGRQLIRNMSSAPMGGVCP